MAAAGKNHLASTSFENVRSASAVSERSLSAAKVEPSKLNGIAKSQQVAKVIFGRRRTADCRSICSEMRSRSVGVNNQFVTRPTTDL